MVDSKQRLVEGPSIIPMAISNLGVEHFYPKKEFIKIWEEGILDPLILKICPQTLPRRVLECLLPSDCRDLVKYLGLWRTRDYIENLLRLEQYANIGVGDMLTKWDSVVQSKYNFKAVNFNGRGGLKSGTFESS